MRAFFSSLVFLLLLWIAVDSSIASTHTYDVVNGSTLQLDYYPAQAATPAPALVFLHGGCFSMGSRKDMAADLKELTKDGIAVFSADYRLSTVAKYPAAVQDVQQAIRFIRKNAKMFNIDPGKIMVHGESAGGYLAAILGVRAIPDRQGKIDDLASPVAFVSDWYGRTDFTATQTSGTDCAESFLGVKRTSVTMKAFEEASVTSKVETKTTEFLLIHGTADQQVYPFHSTILANALWRKGVKAGLYFFEDQGHGFAREKPWLVTKTALLEFLKKPHGIGRLPLKNVKVALEERSPMRGGFELLLELPNGTRVPLLMKGSSHDFDQEKRTMLVKFGLLTEMTTPRLILRFSDANDRGNVLMNPSYSHFVR